MLELRKGADILAGIGGIKTIEEARALFQKRMDQENLGKIGKIQNEEALLKIANAIAMCDPETVLVNSGSDADVKTMRALSVLFAGLVLGRVEYLQDARPEPVFAAATGDGRSCGTRTRAQSGFVVCQSGDVHRHGFDVAGGKRESIVAV